MRSKRNYGLYQIFEKYNAWNDESGADGEKDKKLVGINFDYVDEFLFRV